MSEFYVEKELPPATVHGGTRDPYAPGAGRHMRYFLKESRTRNAYDPYRFRKFWRKSLGLREVQDHRGKVRTIYDPREQKVWADEFPVMEVARELRPELFQEIREALAPVTASTQQDINAYSIYIGGLVEQKFLEGYQLPDFWGRGAISEIPTSVREQRITCEANMNLPDRDTDEATEYPNQGILPRWIIRPPVIKYGQKASLTQEAVVFGLGGELLSAIQAGGKSLAYLEEYLIAAMVMGINIPAGTPGFMDGYNTNQYRYNAQPNDNPNATYQTAKGTGNSLKYNYVNKFGGKPLTGYQDLQFARGQLSLMREFETGFPILGYAKDLIVQPAFHDNAEVIIHAKQVFPVYGTAGVNTPSAGGGPVGGAMFSDNPSGNSALNLRSSPIWNKVLTDSGITQTNADLYWLIGDLKRAFAWASVWNTRVQPMNPQSAELMSRDIVGAWVYSWFGCPYVQDPRNELEFTN